MTAETDCIFCKIVAGEIPSFLICEDAESYAFMDINPVHAGHALVVPRQHAADIYTIDGESLAAVARTAQRVAKAVRQAMAPSGLNLVQCNGEAAGQSVFHFHMHVMPRADGDDLKMNWGLRAGDMKEIEDARDRIKACLEQRR